MWYTLILLKKPLIIWKYFKSKFFGGGKNVRSRNKALSCKKVLLNDAIFANLFLNNYGCPVLINL